MLIYANHQDQIATLAVVNWDRNFVLAGTGPGLPPSRLKSRLKPKSWPVLVQNRQIPAGIPAAPVFRSSSAHSAYTSICINLVEKSGHFFSYF